jgi:hypothetical protein
MIQVKRFCDSRCLACGLLYQPVDWLAWRVRGYCCEDCDPAALKEESIDAQGELFGASPEAQRGLELTD